MIPSAFHGAYAALHDSEHRTVLLDRLRTALQQLFGSRRIYEWFGGGPISEDSLLQASHSPLAHALYSLPSLWWVGRTLGEEVLQIRSVPVVSALPLPSQGAIHLNIVRLFRRRVLLLLCMDTLIHFVASHRTMQRILPRPLAWLCVFLLPLLLKVHEAMYFFNLEYNSLASRVARLRYLFTVRRPSTSDASYTVVSSPVSSLDSITLLASQLVGLGITLEVVHRVLSLPALRTFPSRLLRRLRCAGPTTASSHEEEENGSVVRDQRASYYYTTDSEEEEEDEDDAEEKVDGERSFGIGSRSEPPALRIHDATHGSRELRSNADVSATSTLYRCVLCLRDVARNPTATLCGHVYCWKCIWEYCVHRGGGGGGPTPATGSSSPSSSAHTYPGSAHVQSTPERALRATASGDGGASLSTVLCPMCRRPVQCKDLAPLASYYVREG